MSNARIPDQEYKDRIRKAAALIKARGLDVLLVNSTEADYANVRYFSGFWPLFERAGVAINSSGDAALIVGPESAKFGADISRIERIFVSLYYRESANPGYPELKTSDFKDVFKALGVTGTRPRIGVCSLLDTTAVIMDGIRQCYPDAEIIDVFDIMVTLRSIKSENEL
ncbi:MAG: aminopeptidase P family N-terminal domain-containing protein, partial [Treponema sp.]|nr:aminopeptidase P family N-terminal domain-containing protein [Treponema sp.]